MLGIRLEVKRKKEIMTIHQIGIPEEIQLGDFELKMMVASRLFEEGRLSSGQACRIVGLSKKAFIEILGKYNVSIFGYSYSEIAEDLVDV